MQATWMPGGNPPQLPQHPRRPHLDARLVGWLQGGVQVSLTCAIFEGAAPCA